MHSKFWYNLCPNWVKTDQEINKNGKNHKKQQKLQPQNFEIHKK